MKAKSAFDHPVTGEKVMPGQTIDEKGLDKDQLEDLKNRGYADDGEGYKAGEKVDFAKMSVNELKAYAQALGIDTGQIRDRERMVGAINARQAQISPPAPGEAKRTTLVFGPGTRAHEKVEDVSAEDQAKRNEELAKARSDHEAEIRQSGGDKKRAAPPERKPRGEAKG